MRPWRSVRRSRTSSCRTPTKSWKQSAAWRPTEMAIDVTMPQMGESVVEGTIAKWLVKEGDVVVEDQPLVEISTEKVDPEIPAPGGGRISKIVAAEGQTIPVGATLAVIEPAGAETGAKLKVVAAKSAAKQEPAQEKVAAKPNPPPKPASSPAPAVQAS